MSVNEIKKKLNFETSSILSTFDLMKRDQTIEKKQWRRYQKDFQAGNFKRDMNEKMHFESIQTARKGHKTTYYGTASKDHITVMHLNYMRERPRSSARKRDAVFQFIHMGLYKEASIIARYCLTKHPGDMLMRESLATTEILAGFPEYAVMLCLAGKVIDVNNLRNRTLLIVASKKVGDFTMAKKEKQDATILYENMAGQQKEIYKPYFEEICQIDIPEQEEFKYIYDEAR